MFGLKTFMNERSQGVTSGFSLSAIRKSVLIGAEPVLIFSKPL